MLYIILHLCPPPPSHLISLEPRKRCLWHVSWRKLSANSVCTSALWVKKWKMESDRRTPSGPEVGKDCDSLVREQRQNQLGGVRCLLQAPDLSVSFFSLFCCGPNIAGGQRENWRLGDLPNPSSLILHWLSALLHVGAALDNVQDHTLPFYWGEEACVGEGN